MTLGASSAAGPGQGTVADALARTLLDPTTCPSCGATLAGPMCTRCGVELSGDAGKRIWVLGHTAVLTLREREQILAGLRADAARAREHALDQHWAPPVPPTLPPRVPAGSPGPARGPAVQSILVGLGALLLAVAAVVFLAVAWDLLGLAGRAAVVAVLTAAALGGAAGLRPRLPETAEALGALGAVLVLGDAWAARATGLGGADVVPALLYAAVVAAVVAVLLGALGAAARLRSGTVTAALLAPAAPVLAGLHLATLQATQQGTQQGTDQSPVVPIVAGLLCGALVAGGRALLPARLRAEARVARFAAVGCSAVAALLLASEAPSAEVVAAVLAGVFVLALQAVADASTADAAGHGRSGAPISWPAAWSLATGAAAVLSVVPAALIVPAALTVHTGPDGRWGRPATAVIAAALAAAALLTAARRVPGGPLGRRLPGLVRAGLRPPALAAGAAIALAVTALPVAVDALEVLTALVRASSATWRAGPGTPIGALLVVPWPASTAEQLALTAGLAVPGLLLLGTGAGPVRGRTGAVLDAARRGGAVALVAGVVLLCTLPGLRVVTGVALLATAAVAAGALAVRVRRAAVPLACAVLAAAAALLGWTSQVTSAPVTTLGVLGLLAARRAVARPDGRAALTGGAVLAGGLALTAATAPLLEATGTWADLAPAAAAGLAATLAVACAVAGVAALVLPADRARDWLGAERRAAAGIAAAAGVLALAGTLTAGRFAGSAVVLAALLAVAATAAAADTGIVGPDVRAAAAGAVPVLAAGVATAAAAAARLGDSGVALAAVLAAVAVAVGLVVLALRVPSWAADPRRLPAEVGAAVAAAGGLALGGALPGGWLLFALTGAGLAALAATPGRSRLADVSIAPLAVASALLLAQAGVGTPEAYTLPPALALLTLGAYRLRMARELGSWPALGPGLVLALAPSVVVAADGGPLVRVVVLALGAGGAVLVGVRRRLAAPLIVGGAALAVHAVVQLGPSLVELGTSVPRWTVLATVGALLLLEGATYERQVTRLRAAAIRLASLR